MTTDQQDTGTAALDTDVLVVGAGPTGLMLAAELRLGGAEVVVVDQRPGPTTESRASTLHARTMEILDSRGLLDGLGSPPCEPRGHFGGVPLDLTLPGPYPGQWKVAQTRTEELLERRAADLGADLWRRHQLLSLTVRDGADGAPEGWRPRPSARTVRSASGPAIWWAATARTAPCDGWSGPPSRGRTPGGNCCGRTSPGSASPTGASSACGTGSPSPPPGTG